MLRAITIIAGLTLATAASAEGRLSAERSLDLPNAAPAEVWAEIGEFCAIAEWHEAVSKCTTEERDGALYRHLTLEAGVLAERQTEAGDTSYGYAIQPGVLPVANSLTTFAVASDGGEGSRITWRSTFDPTDLSDADTVALMEGIYDAGLSGIAQKFE